jgi:DNA-binding NarL/FixJ family response regulator
LASLCASLAFAVGKALWNAGKRWTATKGRHEQSGHGDEGSWELVLKIYPKERQVADLLLAGCANKEIGKELHIASRRVKNILTKLFIRFEITDGVKRVKLAALLYREQVYTSAGPNL